MQTETNGDLVREKKSLITTHFVLTEANNKLWLSVFNITITATLQWPHVLQLPCLSSALDSPLLNKAWLPSGDQHNQWKDVVTEMKMRNGSVLGCLGLVFWFKQFPAMRDMIKMTKCSGNIVLWLTLHTYSWHTACCHKMYTVIQDMNSGAREGERHLESPSFCQFASNCFAGNV